MTGTGPASPRVMNASPHEIPRAMSARAGLYRAAKYTTYGSWTGRR
jgi:hypothetical protein